MVIRLMVIIIVCSYMVIRQMVIIIGRNYMVIRRGCVICYYVVIGRNGFHARLPLIDSRTGLAT